MIARFRVLAVIATSAVVLAGLPANAQGQEIPAELGLRPGVALDEPVPPSPDRIANAGTPPATETIEAPPPAGVPVPTTTGSVPDTKLGAAGKASEPWCRSGRVAGSGTGFCLIN